MARTDQVRRCLGGPHDGRLACAAKVSIAFLDSDGHAFTKPKAGRALYEWTGEAWAYLGVNAYRCECGAFVRQRLSGAGLPSCPVCGADRPRADDRAA